MATYLAAYVATLVAFIVVDGVWLATMAARLYRPILGDILAAEVNIPPAIVFYLLFPIGVLVFAVLPALKTGSLATALIYGALFGFFTYATYDLTNHATLRNWALQITLVDIAWGSFVSAFAAAAGFWAGARAGGAA